MLLFYVIVLLATPYNINNVSDYLQLVCLKRNSKTMVINIIHNTDRLTVGDHFGWCRREASSSASCCNSSGVKLRFSSSLCAAAFCAASKCLLLMIE